MKIRQIRIQNVKSYLDETIHFNNGVNFISGVNGAGKTTIIESIGYAVFNSKPDNIGEFIRYGAKTGTITVELEANDNRLYRLVRKFGNVNSWLVFDIETESEIDLHGVVDIVPFLKEVLGIEPDQDISQLFEDVIGISQGSFTTPFLLTPSIRREQFNRVFKVDSYKTAHSNILKTIRKLEELMKLLEISRAEKTGGISDYEQVREKADEMSPLIVRMEKELQDRKTGREKAEKARGVLRNREKEINRTSREIQIRDERIMSIGDSLARLGEDLKNARTSEEAVLISREGYNTYAALKKEQENIEKQRTDRDALKEAYAQNESRISEFTARIETERKSVDAEKADIEASGKVVSVETATAERNFEIYSSKLKSASELRERLDVFQKYITNLDVLKNSIIRLTTKIRANAGKWEELERSMEATSEFISRESVINEGAEKLRKLEEMLKSVGLAMAAEKQGMDTMKENLVRAEGGKCPFLDARCMNVDEGLDKYFADRLEESLKSLAKMELKEKELSNEIFALEGLKKDYAQLGNEKENIKIQKKIEATYMLELRNDLDQLLKNGLMKQAGDTLKAVKVLTDETKVLDEQYSSLSDAFENFKTVSYDASTAAGNFRKALEALEQAENVAEKSEKLLEEFNRMQKITKDILDEKYRSGLEASAKAGRDMENCRRQKEELSVRSVKVADRLEKIREANLTLEKVIGKKRDIAEKLAVFEGLDGKLLNAANGLSANQAAYDTYMKHQTEAMKLQRLMDETARGNESLQKENAEREQMKQQLDALQKDFSEDVLLEAEKLVEKLAVEYASAEKDILERRNDLDELKNRLSVMDKLKTEINTINEKLDQYSKIRDTTVFIRNLLNKAGERISAVYREHMANEANRIYREVSRENVTLEWREDYEVFLVDLFNGRERNRSFRQLSGGEQMTAALAMRLAMLRQLSGAGIGFFDEPTTNLDVERRSNLAQIIPQVTGTFDQLFVISHDDSFDSMTENIVQLKKDSGDGTKIM